MNWFEALILGLIQGLTEYLPVSSSGHLAIGACQDDDAVAALFIQLDDGMAGRSGGHLDMVTVAAVAVEGLQQHAAVLAYRTGEAYLIARTAQRNSLIKALAAAELLHPAGGDRLARTDKVLQEVGLVDVQGAENNQSHDVSPQLLSIRARSQVCWLSS